MKKFSSAFTIVELIIVVAVIAILAALVTVGYSGLTKRATEASMRSDLDVATAEIARAYKKSGAYPLDIADLNGGTGIPTSNGNELYYVVKPYGYCISVYNEKLDVEYRTKSNTTTTEQASCSSIVSTVAGNGTSATVDGLGTAARFTFPSGIAYDKVKNVLYVAQSSGHVIRKVTLDGDVKTFVGTGVSGYVEGTGTAAQLASPARIAVDSSGNLFVTENINTSASTRIRKITPDAVTSTYTNAVNWPWDVDVTRDGTLYVVEKYNQRVRKVSPTGVVTLLAGNPFNGKADGQGAAASFDNPTGVAVSESGNIYIADWNNNLIRKITPSGYVSTIAGTGVAGLADGPALSAQFNRPNDIAVDSSDNLYIVDTNNQRIRMLTPDGMVRTIAGSSTYGFRDGDAVMARFWNPESITLGPNGDLYIADGSNNRIRKITF